MVDGLNGFGWFWCSAKVEGDLPPAGRSPFGMFGLRTLILPPPRSCHWGTLLVQLLGTELGGLPLYSVTLTWSFAPLVVTVDSNTSMFRSMFPPRR